MLKFSLHAPRIILFILLIGLAGCQARIQDSGSVLKPDDVDKIIVGVTDFQEVRRLLGPPTVVNSFRRRRWIYIQDRKYKNIQRTFSRAANRIEITFDSQGIVEKLERNFGENLIDPELEPNAELKSNFGDWIWSGEYDSPATVQTEDAVNEGKPSKNKNFWWAPLRWKERTNTRTPFKPEPEGEVENPTIEMPDRDSKQEEEVELDADGKPKKKSFWWGPFYWKDKKSANSPAEQEVEQQEEKATEEELDEDGKPKKRSFWWGPFYWKDKKPKTPGEQPDSQGQSGEQEMERDIPATEPDDGSYIKNDELRNAVENGLLSQEEIKHLQMEGNELHREVEQELLEPRVVKVPSAVDGEPQMEPKPEPVLKDANQPKKDKNWWRFW